MTVQLERLVTEATTAAVAVYALRTGDVAATWGALGASGALVLWADADGLPGRSLTTVLLMIVFVGVALDLQGISPLGGPITWALAALALATCASWLRATRRTGRREEAQ